MTHEQDKPFHEPTQAEKKRAFVATGVQRRLSSFLSEQTMRNVVDTILDMEDTQNVEDCLAKAREVDQIEGNKIFRFEKTVQKTYKFYTENKQIEEQLVLRRMKKEVLEKLITARFKNQPENVHLNNFQQSVVIYHAKVIQSKLESTIFPSSEYL